MIRFVFMEKAKGEQFLPMLFDILYDNMRIIAPSGEGYEEDKRIWLSNVAPAIQKEPRQIILMYADDDLAGYLQYYINGGIFMVEEIQIKSQYQRTTLFYAICRFMLGIISLDTIYIEAYAEKRNQNSRRIIGKLGMEQIGENGSYLHYRGSMDSVRNIFAK